MAAIANIQAGNAVDRSSGSVRPARVLNLSVAVSFLAHASVFAAAFIWWQGDGKPVQRGLPQGQSVTFVSLVSQVPAPAKNIALPKPDETRKVKATATREPVQQKHVEAIKKQSVEKQKIAQLSPASDASQTSDASAAIDVAASSASSPAIDAAALSDLATGAPSASGGKGEQAVFIEPQFRAKPQPPTYPRRARRLEQEGEALIRVKLDPHGNPAEVLVWKSSGFALLDSAAIAAVRHWKFVPAEQSGRPVIAWVQIPVHFSLN